MDNKYFTDLNYSLGNEDTSLEYELVKKFQPSNILSVCGSGGRSLPLISFGASELVCCDLASQQLLLSELRMACYQQLSYKDFLRFFAYPPYGEYDYSLERKAIFKELKISDSCRFYFNNLFKKNKWNSILYLGKWERTFKILSMGLRLILGKQFDLIFSTENIYEQKAFYKKLFPLKRWKSVIFLLGNKGIFNALLYKGNFIKKNVKESHFDYYFNSFENIFHNIRVRESFFMHLCFYGKLMHEDALPLESTKKVFKQIKESLKNCKFLTVKQNIIDYCTTRPDESLDFISFSDVPSYFDGDLEINYLQEIRSSLKIGGVVVVRYYLKICNPKIDGYEDITDEFEKLIKNEKVQMYRVKIYKKIN